MSDEPSGQLGGIGEIDECQVEGSGCSIGVVMSTVSRVADLSAGAREIRGMRNAWS